MTASEDMFITRYDECLGIQIFDTVDVITGNSCYKGFFLRFKTATLTGTKFSDVILLCKKGLGGTNSKEYNEWVLLGEAVIIHTRMVLTEKKNFKYKAI